MTFRPIHLLALILAIAAWPARAETIELAPSSNWTVSFDDASCALLRQFGGPDRLVVLEIRQFEPGSGFQAVINTSAFDTRRGETSMTLLPDTPQDQDHTFGVTGTDGSRGYVYLSSFKLAADRDADREAAEDDLPVLEWPIEAQIERERNISGILIGGGFENDLLLQTGALGQPMNVMRTCMNRQMATWGIDVVAHESLSRPARPLDLSEWSRQLSRRYPSAMAREGRQAIVWARVTVGTDGQVTDCAVQSTMSDELFNQTACQLLIRYGRFEPALDAQMQPLTSYWVGSIVYSFR